ncbi:hypothetical protein PHAVU_011G176950 [Phaseolus vulgaris]|uniref:glucan endo-1,3-beta-glucosidase-like n=1 Tax=Phaseolus vulgaris TaxID=3885 RepID=UPI0035C9C2E8
MFLENTTQMSSILVLLLLGLLSSIAAAESIGVCYGVIANNLPSKKEVVDLYKSNGIGKMRIYFPEAEKLDALRGSGIELIMDVARESLQAMTDQNAATDWVRRNVIPYAQDVNFKYIAVGNEVRPNHKEAPYILSAMRNIQNAISSANLQGRIKVSTAIDSTLISNPYPPNDGVFNSESYVRPIIEFLKSNGSPLLANVYPYFAHIYDKQHIPLEYALFTQQGKNSVGYQNLFDAMLDSKYAALEKMGAPDVKIVVSESGWPSEGGDAASTQNAATYYANLISHAKGGSGTPKRPGGSIETYLFAMFDENNKTGDKSEKYFGLFTPDKSPKYQLSFN